MAARFRYLPQLDGLRGVAVLLVVIGHVITNSLKLSGPFARLASLGVMLFFVLSGYLITGLLCDEFDRKGTISIRRFYQRRALRILPAVAVFVLAIAVFCLLGWTRDTRWRDLVASLFFVRNLFGSGYTTGHLWSLSIEQQFYLFWPLLFLRTHPRQSLVTALVLTLAVAVWRGVAVALRLYPYEGPIVYFRTDFRIDSLMAGCTLALVLHQDGRAAAVLRRCRRWLHPAWVAPAFIWWGLQSEFVLEGMFQPIYLTVQTVACTALLYWLVTDQDSWTGNFCRQGWLRWVGAISYSLYLWQEPFICMREVDWGWARQFPGDVVCAFAAAAASFYLIERPFLRLKEASRRQETVAATATTIQGVNTP